VLVSIQSLFSANPFTNEPGFERGGEEGDEAAYAAKLTHETIRVTVLDRIEEYMDMQEAPAAHQSSGRTLRTSSGVNVGYLNGTVQVEEAASAKPSPFNDRCKMLFLWYHETYVAICKKEKSQHACGEQFVDTVFEGLTNRATGSYQYAQLLTRLEKLYAAVDGETKSWQALGADAMTNELQIGPQMHDQFNKVNGLLRARLPPFRDLSAGVELELADSANPFLWELTLLGPYDSPLEGAVIRAHIHTSPQFPRESPRVRVLTPLFHQRVTAHGGYLSYPARLGEANMAAHVDGVLRSLIDKGQLYDPRLCVNVEASRLLWGCRAENVDADPVAYRRRLARSAQASME
jgi:ubiquitin-conjugating enzyme E2 Z